MFVWNCAGDDAPHAAKGGLGERLSIVQGYNEFSAGVFAPFQQLGLKVGGHPNVTFSGCGFEVVRDDGGLTIRHHGVVAYMDDVVFEVNICPMQSDDFSAAHAGTKTDERKNVCAGILDLRENAFTLFFVEGGFLRRR